MSQGPNPLLAWLLWWLVFFDLPRCEGDCGQAHKPCNCRKEK